MLELGACRQAVCLSFWGALAGFKHIKFLRVQARDHIYLSPTKGLEGLLLEEVVQRRTAKPPKMSLRRHGDFPKLGVPCWGIPIIRIVVFSGVDIEVPLYFWKLPQKFLETLSLLLFAKGQRYHILVTHVQNQPDHANMDPKRPSVTTWVLGAIRIVETPIAFPVVRFTTGRTDLHCH